MNSFFRKNAGCIALMAMTAVGQAGADGGAQLLIRGDQSISLLSEVPIDVNSSHEIFTVRPRFTPRDELISILGNTELFITPPEKIVGSDEESLKIKQEVQTGDGQ